MMERPSPHKNCILKRTAFRAWLGLCLAAIITSGWHRATVKQTGQCWKTTQKSILARPTSQSPSPQIASPGTTPTILSP
jgi:hypothetical protein